MRAGLRHKSVVVAALVGLISAACVAPGSAPQVTDPGASSELQWLRAVRGPDAGIYDDSGRQVQLRGANFNHLGDYFVSDPALPTVATLDEADWSDAAAQGMNVVRLVTSWSAWEPERDQFNSAYLDRVRAAVRQANDHGMYVVIDMHQDAWSKFVFTPVGESCPAGSKPQIGWDGAPAWATFTDNRETCTPGSREDSPAVQQAWASFYANRDGVRDELSELWGRIATEFSDEPGVAGFDLLNEPGYSFDQDSTSIGLAAFYQSAIREIRSAERVAGARGHMVFFENTVNGRFVAPGFSDDANLVFAPHNYAESIGPSIPGLLDLLTGLFNFLAKVYGAPSWVGEYGSFNADPAVRTAYMTRFNRLQDATPGAGGTWWQWEQQCGDPHDVSGAYPPSATWVSEQRTRCSDSPRMAVSCTARSYPRAVPGRLLGLEAEPCGGAMAVSGSTPSPSTAELWFQGERTQPPIVGGPGVGDVAVQQVRGGYRITVGVSGAYRIEVR